MQSSTSVMTRSAVMLTLGLCTLLTGCSSRSSRLESERNPSVQSKAAHREPDDLYELDSERARQLLGMDPTELDKIASTKSMLTDEEFDEFRTQFGSCNGNIPTFQISPGRFYTLIPESSLRCDPDAHPGEAARAIRSILAAGARAGDAAPTPKREVDLRSQQTPVRDQGNRGTCVAFACCAAMEYDIGKRRDDRDSIRLCENLAYLSFCKEEHLRPCDDPGFNPVKAGRYLINYAVPLQDYWAYIPTSAEDLKKANDCRQIESPPSGGPARSAWSFVDGVPLGPGLERFPNDSIDVNDTALLEELLAAGHPIVCAVNVAWRHSDMKGIIDVRRGPAGQPIYSSNAHAVLLVGYHASGGPKYFIAKNSWGADQGHDGYLFFSYEFIAVYARCGFVPHGTRTVRFDPNLSAAEPPTDH